MQAAHKSGRKYRIKDCSCVVHKYRQKAIPPLHHAGAGQHSVQLVAYVAPGDYGDAQLLALLGAPGQLNRKHLGIAGR